MSNFEVLGIRATNFDIFSKTDNEGQLYGLVLANGKRWLEQRKFFSQYLAGSKDQFDEVIGDEVSRFCNEVGGTVLMPNFYYPNIVSFPDIIKSGIKGESNRDQHYVHVFCE